MMRVVENDTRRWYNTSVHALELEQENSGRLDSNVEFPVGKMLLLEGGSKRENDVCAMMCSKVNSRSSISGYDSNENKRPGIHEVAGITAHLHIDHQVCLAVHTLVIRASASRFRSGFKSATFGGRASATAHEAESAKCGRSSFWPIRVTF